jgi:hypothetical protein
VVTAYFSCTFLPAEANYNIYEKEFLAIIKVIQNWRAHLIWMEKPFIIKMDHKNLTYWKEPKKLTVLCSDSSPTFSSFSPLSDQMPLFKVPNIWDCVTIVPSFLDIVPAHPLDILPHLAPEPFSLALLLCSWPYTLHHFTEFCPLHTDNVSIELCPMLCSHQTYGHTLEHVTFCHEAICPTHYPYGGNH